MLSWHQIMYFALFWCIIRKNVHFEGIYLFPLHQHTATSNSTIRQQSRYITSTQQALKDGALARVRRLLWERLWLWFKSSGFSNIRKYTNITKQYHLLPWTWTWRIQNCDYWYHFKKHPGTVESITCELLLQTNGTSMIILFGLQPIKLQWVINICLICFIARYTC